MSDYLIVFIVELRSELVIGFVELGEISIMTNVWRGSKWKEIIIKLQIKYLMTLSQNFHISKITQFQRWNILASTNDEDDFRKEELDVLERLYYRGRRKGILIGATATIPILVIAYIISEGIVYWK